ncbi:MAG: type I restriction endonuclease subunit R [Acidimicrobiales bacterium]
MSAFVAESAVEEVCLDLFAELGWVVRHGPEIGPGEPAAERSSYREVLLDGRLRAAVARLNPGLSGPEVAEVVATFRRPESAELKAESWRAYSMLTRGVPFDRRLADGSVRADRARLVDFEDPAANEFVVVNQFSVQGDSHTRRPDVVAFVNGIPLALIELKAPGQERATLQGAFDQLRTYAADVPALLAHTACCVISTGTQARIGPLPESFGHFAPWKTINGDRLAPTGTPEMHVLVQGVFQPVRFLDLVRSFVTFSDERTGLVKRLARYHQFHAVNKAVVATLGAMQRGDGRAGVVWHTQGSGKSLEMLLCTTKLMAHPGMANPTVVVLTDRNDLDDQLFDEVFAAARTLPEAPVQASSREHLRQLLAERASGGIIFSTMQKFGRTKPERDANQGFPVLSGRSNVVVIADEAHRTQYDLLDGLARNVRDALPGAVFMGFTGTPIQAGDRDTRAIFGEYIDIYDLTQAVEDEATVRVYYEARLVRVDLPEDARAGLDAEVAEVTEASEADDRERLKSRWARVEAVVGADRRIAQVAADIVAHWEARRAVELGKGLIVCMSRRICIALYDYIVAIRPQWHSSEDGRGQIKVVITGSASDGPDYSQHVRNKDRLRELKARAKDPDDPLELVIVRDMWLTGFDSPSLHTMYVDKPMRGAGLMQAIARVNRTFLDKPGGLVVDYIGIAESLRAALADYTARDRANEEMGAPVTEALAVLVEAHEVCCELLFGCPWREALDSGSDQARIEALMEALELLLGGQELELPERFAHHERRARQSFAICAALPEAGALRDDLAFFQSLGVEVRRARSESVGGGGGDIAVETALRQLVSEAISASGVIDIYAEAGLERPDLSLIYDDFALRAVADPRPNLQIELLRRLLSSEVRNLAKRNVVAERRFSEMLERAMNAYTNRSLTAAEVIAAMVAMARALREEHDRGTKLGLRDDELAFYDAVCQNDSAVLELGDETLKQIARELVEAVRRNSSVDWDRKEQVRASMRRHIRRLLVKHHYPPDKQEKAIVLVMDQAERLAAQVVA